MSGVRSLVSLGELASLPCGSDHELPPELICPSAELRDKPHDHRLPEMLQVPVFDMSKFSDTGSFQERKAFASDVNEACKEWGFFQVVNHGVPLDVIHKVKELGLGFFALPTEQKEKGALGKYNGYQGRNLDMQTKDPWRESLTIAVHPVHKIAEIADRVWPEPNQEFVEGIKGYSDCVAHFSQKLWILLAESLGLESNTFNSNSEDCSTAFRFSLYPPCPHPSVALGLGPHTDPNLITILYQDEVGGLEVHHQERGWTGVEPHAGAFLVFLGDSLQAWTNDHYHSVEHRVVVNPNRARISMAFFIVPSRDVVINPLEKWIDEVHPLKYKSFTWGDVEEWIKELTMIGETPTFKRSWLSKIVVK